MDFETLYNRISPRLRRIARRHGNRCFPIDEDDLYQEMCCHLWSNFKSFAEPGKNDYYIARGCEFHLLNYMRINREKAKVSRLEEPVNERGDLLKDMLRDNSIDIDRSVDKKITIDNIMNNGFTKREKEVFALLLEGHTTREAGAKLGISHVMVVKSKKNLIRRWQKKNNSYQNRRIFT